ncbi:hypothetical protein SAHC1340_01553 [Staphylococcus aureus]|nr:hypothetical protein SAHC1340_01553 [Staphylococcus aureus]EJE56530.1 hypothetical protein Newbould305_1282 [Staphylococcus aureus subsp. aureus str. Newbould 305]EOR31734.1 hypothetical protein S091751_2831 [Staphylococcus aureus subsp. aureus 091751]EOR36775.1 hypothetical protein S103564_0515 [Staphylococcus aureus subsp. aureus 103564]EOR39777.1 hypothetical protein MRGR3_1652 [Staphylococcus aureus subsp. aureus MRGR3]
MEIISRIHGFKCSSFESQNAKDIRKSL